MLDVSLYLSVCSGRHLSLELPPEFIVRPIVHELTGVAETAKASLLVILTNVWSVIPTNGCPEMCRSSLRPGGHLGGRPQGAVLLFDELCVVVGAAIDLVLEVDALFPRFVVGDFSILVGLLGTLK